MAVPPADKRLKRVPQANVFSGANTFGLDALVESMAQGLVAAVASPEASLLATPAQPLRDLPRTLLDLPMPAVAEPKAPVKPRVGIVGLLPIQAGTITSAWGDKLDMHFWNDGDDKGKLKAMAESCEVVFLHTRHAGHKTDQLLNSFGAELRRVTGGTTNMQLTISAYFSEVSA